MGFAAGLNAGSRMIGDAADTYYKLSEQQAAMEDRAEKKAKEKAINDALKAPVGMTKPRKGKAIDDAFLAKQTTLDPAARKELLGNLKNVKDEDLGTVLAAYSRGNTGEVVPPKDQMDMQNRMGMQPATVSLDEPPKAPAATGAAALTPPAAKTKVEVGGIADPNNPNAGATHTEEAEQLGGPGKQPTVDELMGDPSLVGEKGRAHPMADTDTTDPVGDLPMGADPKAKPTAETAEAVKGGQLGADALKAKPAETAQDLAAVNGEAAKTDIPVEEAATAADPSKVDQKGMPQSGAAPADFLTPEELKAAYTYRGPDGQVYMTKEALTPLSPGELMREQALRLQQLGDVDAMKLGVQLMDQSFKLVKQEYDEKINDVVRRHQAGEIDTMGAIKALGGAYNENGVLPGTAEAFYDPQTGMTEMRVTTPDGRVGSGPGRQHKSPEEALQYLVMEQRAMMDSELYLKLAESQLKERAESRLQKHGDAQIAQEAKNEEGRNSRFTEGQEGENYRLGVREEGENSRLAVREEGENSRLATREAGETKRTGMREAGATARNNADIAQRGREEAGRTDRHNSEWKNRIDMNNADNKAAMERVKADIAGRIEAAGGNKPNLKEKFNDDGSVTILDMNTGKVQSRYDSNLGEMPLDYAPDKWHSDRQTAGKYGIRAGVQTNGKPGFVYKNNTYDSLNDALDAVGDVEKERTDRSKAQGADALGYKLKDAGKAVVKAATTPYSERVKDASFSNRHKTPEQRKKESEQRRTSTGAITFSK